LALPWTREGTRQPSMHPNLHLWGLPGVDEAVLEEVVALGEEEVDSEDKVDSEIADREVTTSPP